MLILGFTNETRYLHEKPLAQQTNRGPRLLILIGANKHSILNSSSLFRSPANRLVAMLLKPIVLPIMLYYAASFMWAIGMSLILAILFATKCEAGWRFTTLGTFTVGHTSAALGQNFGLRDSVRDTGWGCCGCRRHSCVRACVWRTTPVEGGPLRY